MQNYRDPFIGYDQWKTTDPDMDFNPDDDNPPAAKKAKSAIRWHECTGCTARKPRSLGVTHGAEHRNCPQTTGVVGYWVEIPNNENEDTVSAAEWDWLVSWGVK